MGFDWLIVDGNNTAWRAGSVMQLRNQKGENTSVAFGMLSMIRSLLEDYQPKAVCVCWDEGGSKAKEELYPEYKQNRKKSKSPLPEEFFIEIKVQMKKIQSILPYFGVRQLIKSGIEADDLIGLLCMSLNGVLVVSSDKDLFQVVDMGASLFHPPRNVIINKQNFKEHAPVDPELYVYYRSVEGDLGDGIPGLRWFGPVTVKKLIEKYGPWTEWFEGGTVKVSLLEDLNKRQWLVLQDGRAKDTLTRNYALMDIGRLVLSKKEEMVREVLAQKPALDELKIKEFFFENQFNAYLAKFHGWIHPFRRLVKE